MCEFLIIYSNQYLYIPITSGDVSKEMNQPYPRLTMDPRMNEPSIDQPNNLRINQLPNLNTDLEDEYTDLHGSYENYIETE